MKTLEERFWSKVNKNSGTYGADGKFPTECWEWIGALMTQGYGHLRIDGRNQKAHRILFLLKGITLKSEDCVLHKCDNRLCVNPDHLSIGTQRDNAQDTYNKGRNKGAIGAANFNTKLTAQAVIEIREAVAAGSTHREMADRFHVSRTTISHIIRRHIWQHVK